MSDRLITIAANRQVAPHRWTASRPIELRAYSCVVSSMRYPLQYSASLIIITILRYLYYRGLRNGYYHFHRVKLWLIDWLIDWQSFKNYIDITVYTKALRRILQAEKCILCTVCRWLLKCYCIGQFCKHSSTSDKLHLIPASDAAHRRRCLRSANRNCLTVLSLLTVPRCRLSTYGCRTFHYVGPTVWNSLAGELRNSDSFDSLKNGSWKKFSLAATSLISALEVFF